jgi:hypothetical protein
MRWRASSVPRTSSRVPFAALALLLSAGAFAAGCQNAATVSETAPDAVKCQVSLTTPPSIDAAGGASKISVTTQPECAWDVTTSASWISGLSPTSGQGSGDVNFRVAANDGTAAREGEIAVNNNRIRVSQRAACRYEVTPPGQHVGLNGGGASVTVTTGGECAWTATTDVSWITLSPPASGTGTATVNFTVAPGSDERIGGVVIGGQRATVTQTGNPACTYAIAPSNQSVAATGGAGTPVSVTTQDGCRWTATSNASWITVATGASGIGNGSTTFAVAANAGPSRSGTLTIANSTFTVSQAAAGAPPCTFSIAPANHDAAGTAATGTITVTAGAGCAWTATSNASWITVTSGAEGNGNGAVGYSIAANSGAQRTGTLSVAGQTFTVTQAAAVASPCTLSIAPTTQDASAAASTGTIAVTAGSGCAWTAASNATWITVTSGATGNGNGVVGYSIAANAGAQRTGTLSVAGQTFTVTQAAAAAPPCTFSIAPTNQDAPATATSGTIAVTAGSGCAWTAASNASWITVSTGAGGNGNGTVGYNIAANSGAQRTGTLTVAGQTFTVTQAAAAPSCTYSVSPATFDFDASAAAGFVNVTTAAGCAWTATSNTPFVVIRQSSASGSGSAVVGFDIFSNVGADRMGTLTIAGQTVTVTQAAPIPPCTYSLSPSSATAPATASTGSFDVIVSPRQDCAWTAGNISQPWLTFTSPSPITGRGNATLTYTVAANPGPQRVGTLLVSGQTFTLTQAAGPCTYTISPTTVNMPATASSATVTVTTADGCAWTAMSQWPFITITSGASGSGSGVVAFSVTANGNVPRTGTMLVAGQTITVMQAAATLLP